MGGGGLVQVLSWLTQRLFFSFHPSHVPFFFLLLFFLDTLLNEGHFGWLAFFFNCFLGSVGGELFLGLNGRLF